MSSLCGAETNPEILAQIHTLRELSAGLPKFDYFRKEPQDPDLTKPVLDALSNIGVNFSPKKALEVTARITHRKLQTVGFMGETATEKFEVSMHFISGRVRVVRNGQLQYLPVGKIVNGVKIAYGYAIGVTKEILSAKPATP